MEEKRTFFVMVDMRDLRYRVQYLFSLPRNKYLVALVRDYLNSLDRPGNIFQFGDQNLVTVLRKHVLLEKCFGRDKGGGSIHTLPTHFYPSYILTRLLLGVKNTAKRTLYILSQLSQKYGMILPKDILIVCCLK